MTVYPIIWLHPPLPHSSQPPSSPLALLLLEDAWRTLALDFALDASSTGNTHAQDAEWPTHPLSSSLYSKLNIVAHLKCHPLPEASFPPSCIICPLEYPSLSHVLPVLHIYLVYCPCHTPLTAYMFHKGQNIMALWRYKDNGNRKFLKGGIPEFLKESPERREEK